MPLALVFFLATLASAYVCYTVANERHADTRFWLWMGNFIRTLGNTISVFFKGSEY